MVARRGDEQCLAGDGKAVPVDACRIELRIVAFPGGSVREIRLATEARTHPHPSHEAVLFYQVDGRRVQMVNERSHEVNPGDACLQPTGVQHSTFQLIAGMFVEFALPAPLRPNPEATWIVAADARVVRDDVGCTVKVFDLPGYPLVETRLAPGSAIAPQSEAAGRLFYVVAGQLQVRLGDDDAVPVSTGDCLWVEPGLAIGLTAVEGSVFIQTPIAVPA